MDIPALTQLAVIVAREVRRQIPRSSNRGKEGAEGGTTWLKSGLPGYVDLLHTLGRTASKARGGSSMSPMSQVGTPLEDMKRQEKKLLGLRTELHDVDVQELKKAVLAFVDGQHIELDYKLGQAAESTYSEGFAKDLAQYLNSKGYRHKGAKYTPDKVIGQVKNQLTAHQRLLKYNINYNHHNNPTLGEFATMRFPLPLVVANARNALKFKVGNCEEVGSTAFCMLLLARTRAGRIIDQLSEVQCKVELVYAKDSTPEASAHFFVLLNREGADFTSGDRAWLENPETIVCDPWFTDTGMAGPITDAEQPEMEELRDWLRGPEGLPTRIAVRASAVLGSGLPGDKSSDLFRLP